jgi:hypothetical protein
MNRLLITMGLSALLAIAPATAQKPDEANAADQTLREMMDELLRNAGEPETPSGSSLDQLIEAASAHPLGGQENPVRADTPRGQRAYLDRLRCENGNAPTYNRVGNFGRGVFGTIIDGYAVECEGSAPASTTVYMDMYHAGYSEPEAVPGFTITD